MELHQAIVPSKYKRKGDLVHETIHIDPTMDQYITHYVCWLHPWPGYGCTIDIKIAEIHESA